MNGSGCPCCLLASLLPHSDALTKATETLPGKRQEEKIMPKSAHSFYVLLFSPPWRELKNPSPRKLRWKRLKSLLPSPLLSLCNRNIS